MKTEMLSALTLPKVNIVMKSTNRAKDRIVMLPSQEDLARLGIRLRYVNGVDAQYSAGAVTAACAGAVTAVGATWLILADKAAKILRTGGSGKRAR